MNAFERETRWQRRKVTVAVVFVASALFAGILLLTRWQHPSSPPGDVFKMSATCKSEDIRKIANDRSDVAIVAWAHCPGIWDGHTYYLIFVHAASRASTNRKVVFVYEPGFRGYDLSPPPEVSWPSDSSLKITAKGVLENVVEQHGYIDGIEIIYSL